MHSLISVPLRLLLPHLQRLNRSSLTWEVLRCKVLKSIGHKIRNTHIIILYLICLQPSLLLTMTMPFIRDVRQPLNAGAKPARPFLVLMRICTFDFGIQKNPKHYQLCTLQRKGYFIPHSVGSNHSGAQTSLGSQTPHSLRRCCQHNANPTCHSPHQPAKSERWDFKSWAVSGDRLWKACCLPAPATTATKPSLHTPENIRIMPELWLLFWVFAAHLKAWKLLSSGILYF